MKFWILKAIRVLAAIWLFSCSLPGRKITSEPILPNTGSNTVIMETNSSLLTSLFQKNPAFYDSFINHKDSYGIQIIYTQVDRGKNNIPKLTDHYFNLNKDYFYPASTVKLPTALLALQRLNELNISGLDKNTSMITET